MKKSKEAEMTTHRLISTKYCRETMRFLTEVEEMIGRKEAPFLRKDINGAKSIINGILSSETLSRKERDNLKKIIDGLLTCNTAFRSNKKEDLPVKEKHMELMKSHEKMLDLTFEELKGEDQQ